MAVDQLLVKVDAAIPTNRVAVRSRETSRPRPDSKPSQYRDALQRRLGSDRAEENRPSRDLSTSNKTTDNKVEANEPRPASESRSRTTSVREARRESTDVSATESTLQPTKRLSETEPTSAVEVSQTEAELETAEVVSTEQAKALPPAGLSTILAQLQVAESVGLTEIPIANPTEPVPQAPAGLSEILGQTLSANREQTGAAKLSEQVGEGVVEVVVPSTENKTEQIPVAIDIPTETVPEQSTVDLSLQLGQTDPETAEIVVEIEPETNDTAVVDIPEFETAQQSDLTVSADPDSLSETVPSSTENQTPERNSGLPTVDKAKIATQAVAIETSEAAALGVGETRPTEKRPAETRTSTNAEQQSEVAATGTGSPAGDTGEFVDQVQSLAGDSKLVSPKEKSGVETTESKQVERGESKSQSATSTENRTQTQANSAVADRTQSADSTNHVGQTQPAVVEQPASQTHAVSTFEATSPVSNDAVVATDTSAPVNIGQTSTVATPAPTAADVAPIKTELGNTVDQAAFVQRIAEAVNRSNQLPRHLRIQMSPPELGAIQIEVTSRDGVIHAKLEVQSIAAQQAVMENIASLKETLSQLGNNVEQLEVHLNENLTQNGRSATGDGDRQQADDNDGPYLEEWQKNSESSDEKSPTRSSEKSDHDVGNIDELDIQI